MQPVRGGVPESARSGRSHRDNPRMTTPFSIEDAFTVGVMFDLFGGYLLGRGLLASPFEIAQRGSTRWGWNSADVIGQIRSGADARLGLAALATGFVLQAGGYVALIAGAPIRTGDAQAASSVVLAVVVALGGWRVLGRMHLRLVKRLIVSVARTNPVTGEIDDYPDAGRLLALGQELGFLLSEAPTAGNPGVLDSTPSSTSAWIASRPRPDRRERRVRPSLRGRGRACSPHRPPRRTVRPSAPTRL